MKKIISIIVIATLIITATLSVKNAAAQKEKTQIAKLYQCPMKCEGEKTYDKPGKCPICGMQLKELQGSNILYASNSGVNKNSITVVGAMQNVMMKGELGGTIDLDTISNKEHLWGLGVMENLTGELMIIDGKGYKSVVDKGTEIKVIETFSAKAPFFGYANIESWKEVAIPDSVLTDIQLEKFLDQTTTNHPRPFFFRLTGIADSANIHIVNLPAGTKISKPTDAHTGQRSFELKNESIELLGFFSTEHKMIFTHHDSYVHIHLITTNKKKMGHLESLHIKKGTVKLYLPEY